MPTRQSRPKARPAAPTTPDLSTWKPQASSLSRAELRAIVREILG